MVPISTPLQTGSTVEVITSPHQRPSRDWLNIVKSAKARSCIRRWLREEEHTHSVRLGQEIVERELKRRRKRVPLETLQEATRGLGATDLEHFYAGIGNGGFSLEKLCNKLFPTSRPKPRRPRTGSTSKNTGSPLKIHGLKNLMITFARCCRPIQGDPILGIITRGKGVSVHRRDCTNIMHLMEEPERILELDWDEQQEDTFIILVQVIGVDRPRLPFQEPPIPPCAPAPPADASDDLIEGHLKTANGQVGDRFLIEIKNTAQLATLYKKVQAVPGVTSVQRVDEAPDVES